MILGMRASPLGRCEDCGFRSRRSVALLVVFKMGAGFFGGVLALAGRFLTSKSLFLTLLV